MRLLDEKESLEKPTPVQPRANNFRDWVTNIMGRAGDEEGGEESSAGPDGQPFEMPDESGAVRPAADQLAEAAHSGHDGQVFR